MPEKSAEEHLLRDSEMKCIICHAPSLPDHDREALLRLCFESKTGRRLTDGEQGFCGRMYKWFPEEYRVVQEEARKQATQTVNPLAAQEG